LRSGNLGGFLTVTSLWLYRSNGRCRKLASFPVPRRKAMKRVFKVIGVLLVVVAVLMLASPGYSYRGGGGHGYYGHGWHGGYWGHGWHGGYWGHGRYPYWWGAWGWPYYWGAWGYPYYWGAYGYPYYGGSRGYYSSYPYSYGYYYPYQPSDSLGPYYYY
jgi:hypothetical protein